VSLPITGSGPSRVRITSQLVRCVRGIGRRKSRRLRRGKRAAIRLNSFSAGRYCTNAPPDIPLASRRFRLTPFGAAREALEVYPLPLVVSRRFQRSASVSPWGFFPLDSGRFSSGPSQALGKYTRPRQHVKGASKTR
jgi:hypothetical protein